MSAAVSHPADAVFLNDPSNMAGSYGTALVADVKLALDAWVTHLDGLGTLTVQVNLFNAGQNGLLADGAPSLDMQIGTEDGHTLLESGAVHELSTGSHLDNGTSDITINVNAAYLGQEYLGSGSVPAGQYDGLSLFEHEIAHGLGFGGFTSQTGSLDATYETAWDHDLSSIGGTEVFTGANATAANGGVPVNVTTLDNGEGYAHLANSSADRNAADLMSGLGLPMGTRRPISAVDLAILADVGVPVAGMAGTITIGGPASASVVAGVSSSIGGITLADTGVFSSSTLTLTLTDAAGRLSATQAAAATVSASSNGHTLTLAGSLADVRTELASLHDTVSAPGTGAVQVAAIDSFGNTGAASLAVVASGGAVASLVGLPRVLSLAATPVVAGPLGAGRSVSFTLSTSGPVTVGTAGSVGLALSDGGTAAYVAAASSATRLVFTTTVAAGQDTPNLTVTGLTLAGGATIGGATGGDVSLVVNAATAGAATGIVVDTLAPAVPTLALAAASDTGVAGDGITAATTQTLTGTAEAGSTISLTDGTVLLGTATASDAGRWSYAARLASGSHGVGATASDAAGNVSGTAVLALAIDVTAPAAPTLVVAGPAIIAAGPATPAFSGTAEAGSTVTLFEGGVAVATAVAASNGGWSATPSAPLALGTTVLTASASDAAGNVSALSQALDFVRDAPSSVSGGLAAVAAPALTVPAGVPTVVTLNGAAGQVESFAANPGASFVVVDGGAASLVASTDAAGAMTVFGNAGTISFVNGGGTGTVVDNGASALRVGGGLSTSSLVAFLGHATTSYVGGAGADEIIGGAGAMSLTGGTGGSLLVFGGTGSLSLTSGAENDMIIGGAGSETVHAGVGAAFAGTGGSLLFASGAGTFLAGNVSGDRLQASAAGGDILAAGAGNETLAGAGAASADLIFGGSGLASVSLGLGADTFAGGAGGGTVQLGAGDATLYLGTGAATTIAVTAGSAGGTDTVSGFRVGTDHLRLAGYAKPATLTASGSSTTLGLVDGTRIVLAGVGATNTAALLG